MADKTKVLFLIESLGGGGAEKVLLTLVKHIDKTRFDVTVCPITDVGCYSAEIKSYVNSRAILERYPSEGSAIAKLWWKVRYKLVNNWLPMSLVYRLWVPKGNDIEIAFVEGLTTKLLSKAPSRAKKLAWVHTDLENNHWTSSIFKSRKEEAEAYRRYDRVVGVSRIASRAVSKLFGDDIPTTTAYNPIDTASIKRMAAETIDGIPAKKPGTVRICSTGRLVPQKGFDRLIRVVKRLKDEGFNIELWLLGQGELRPQLEALIDRLGLNDSVTLWGFKGNPYAYTAACDLFVCSSLAEGYSTAVTEALILGLPVITTRCSGMEELLGDNNEHGIITDNSEDALYRQLRDTLTTGSFDRLREAARSRGTDFDITALARNIEELLK